jgi:transcription initiation factor TFIIIB Brf1 subunit/transcription initiation factor TFIIB
VLPRRYLPAAVVTAVASYIVWELARASEFSGRGIVSLVAAALFWASLMALAAYAVQAGVDRYRDGP